MPASNENTLLIELMLTSERSLTASDDGGFSAAVVSDGGLAVVVYDCTELVEQTMESWAAQLGMRMVKRSRDPRGLHLAYSSNDPPGNFILDYGLVGEPSEAHIGFWFRSLTNVRFSGEDAGLQPLARRLLKAIQCVPQ